MHLSVNGEKRELLNVNVVNDVLTQLGYDAGKIALAINGEFVPRSQYAIRVVNEGEALDIVAPVQGG